MEGEGMEENKEYNKEGLNFLKNRNK